MLRTHISSTLPVDSSDVINRECVLLRVEDHHLLVAILNDRGDNDHLVVRIGNLPREGPWGGTCEGPGMAPIAAATKTATNTIPSTVPRIRAP